MHNIDLILTLTGGLTFALILGYITQRIGLSPIVGYLLAGIVVSPHTPGDFGAKQEMADQLAEIGVILLMFGVGLQFHIKELLAVKSIAIPGAVGQSLAATVLGMLICWMTGWTWTAGLVYGLAISVASTVVLTRVLADNNDLHTQRGHIAVGWLVVEDIFTVIVLVLLPALFTAPAPGSAPVPAPGSGPVEAAIVTTTTSTSATSSLSGDVLTLAAAVPESGQGPLWLTLLIVGVKMAVLVFFIFIIGGKTIPWILAKVTATRSRELFTLTVLVLALGIAVGSYVLFGASMALGAFLAGMVVGRSDFSLRAASEAMPMRDAFAVLFFVSVGMLFDPQHLFDEPLFVIGTLLVVMIGKPLASLVIVLVMGYPVKTGLAVAVVLGQIGEFSFILATLGIHLKVLPEAATNSLVATAIISITFNPLLYRTVGPIEAWLKRKPALWRLLNRRNKSQGEDAGHEELHIDPHDDPAHRAVVVGYGPVGQTVVRLLRENEITPTVIELNLETVRKLRQQDIPAVYGDAGQRDTLAAAGLEHAATLIFTAPGMSNSSEVIRIAHELNPDVHILARTVFLRELHELKESGITAVFSGEGEVAIAMMETILRDLGATPDQIDRERDRLHEELLSPPQPSA